MHVLHKQFMEKLFTANIDIDRQSVAYNIVFENEKYTFIPEARNPGASSFSFMRENDEWHEQQEIDTALKKQALDVLENYLLSQH